MMIARALKVTSETKGSTSFADDKDIPEWAKGAVEAIKQLGLIKGQGNNIFAPHASATRAETVTVLQSLLALNTNN
ncbi:Endo-1,4-beta-xylanase A precursor [compost metagenome]